MQGYEASRSEEFDPTSFPGPKLRKRSWKRGCLSLLLHCKESLHLQKQVDWTFGQKLLLNEARTNFQSPSLAQKRPCKLPSMFFQNSLTSVWNDFSTLCTGPGTLSLHSSLTISFMYPPSSCAWKEQKYYHNCKFLNFFTPAGHQFRRLLVVSNFSYRTKYTRHGGHATLLEGARPSTRVACPPRLARARWFCTPFCLSPTLLAVYFTEWSTVLWTLNMFITFAPNCIVAYVWQTELLCQWWIHTVKQVLYNIISSKWQGKELVS